MNIIPEIVVPSYSPTGIDGSYKNINPVFKKIKKGCEKAAWKLIENIHDLSITNEDGYSILTYSIATNRSLAFLRALFTRKDLPVNSRDEMGTTPLLQAAHDDTCYKVQKVALLLLHGADVTEELVSELREYLNFNKRNSLEYSEDVNKKNKIVLRMLENTLKSEMDYSEFGCIEC
jgi:hypothetical protein